jgi:hypothetical protein
MACAIEAAASALGQNAALPAYASNRHIGVCISFLVCTVAGFIPAAFFVHAGGPAIVPLSFAATTMAFAAHGVLVSAVVVGSVPSQVLRLATSPAFLIKLLLGNGHGTWSPPKSQAASDP